MYPIKVARKCDDKSIAKLIKSLGYDNVVKERLSKLVEETGDYVYEFKSEDKPDVVIIGSAPKNILHLKVRGFDTCDVRKLPPVGEASRYRESFYEEKFSTKAEYSNRLLSLIEALN